MLTRGIPSHARSIYPGWLLPLFRTATFSFCLCALAPWTAALSAVGNNTGGFYGVTVNGMERPDFVYLVFDDALRPYMAVKDFVSLGFVIKVPVEVRDKLRVVPLFGQAGMVTSIDASQLTLALEVESRWFAVTQLNLNAMNAGKPLPALPGAVLNYSIQLSQSDAQQIALGSIQNLSFFGSAGLIEMTTALTSTGSGMTGSNPAAERKISRLGTRFLHDDEQMLTTLAAGDGVLTESVGVPSVRYGGITWQSNFGLDPTFSTLEIPALFDSARLPSTLEFFLNDKRIGAPLFVTPGQFRINGLPTVDGAGQVKVLIRDALNNERVVNVPFLHTARLYRQGLHSFNYSAGLLRPDLDRYDTPFASSSHRWGLARWLTLDAGATVSAGNKSLGAGATFPLMDNVIGDTNLAVSHSAAGSGQQFGASATWQVSVASVGGSFNRSSVAFRLMGDNLNALAPTKDDLRFFASRALAHDFGSVGISFGRMSAWGGSTRAISILGWSRSFRGFNVSLSGVHSDEGTSAIFMLSLPLGRRGFYSSSLQSQGSTMTLRNDYASAPPTGNGLSWRLATTAVQPSGAYDQTSYMAGLDARSDFGEHNLELDSRQDSLSFRASTAGSIGRLAGRSFYGPPISNGFALVSTGDAPRIPVFRWNLPVAVSDTRGLALVTNLKPYQNNFLSVRPEDIPFEYRITSNEVVAVPRSRGGVFVEFPMVRERPALLVLSLPDGQPVPAGTHVKVQSTGETSQIGVRGEVYFQNLPEKGKVEAAINGSSCLIDVDNPAATDPQPRLGSFTCVLSDSP